MCRVRAIHYLMRWQEQQCILFLFNLQDCSRTAGTMHSIKHEWLEAAVLFAVQHQEHLAVSYSEIVTQINSAPTKKSQSYRLDDLIAAKER